jgi:dihydrofolate reductase
MLVSIIAAIDRRGLIGAEAGLPWHLPADLRRFRALTWGKPILMGRTTFELIGKPLPGRTNIVLSRSPQYCPPRCRVARTLEEALAIAESCLVETGGNEAMIIGGGKVYAEALQRCDRLYLTIVEGDFQGNTYFPIQELLRQSWRPAGEPETHVADETNRYPHSFHILERAWDAAPRPRQRDEDHLDLAAVLARGMMRPDAP